jgi:hypothetical protein
MTTILHNNNLFNWSPLLDNINNSTKCTQNEHDSCDGTVKKVIDGLDNTNMCDCQCHNSSYQLVKRMTSVINQKIRDSLGPVYDDE